MLKTRHVVIFAVVTFVAFVVWVAADWPQGTARVVINDLVSLVLAAVATVFAFLAARAARGRLRGAWVALAVGLLGWTAGTAIWSYYELVLHTDPFPSPADAGYLLLPVGACAAMLLFPTKQSAQSRARMVVDGVIVAASLFMVFWLTLLRPVYEAGAESRLAIVTALAYPVADLVVLTVAAYVAVKPGPYDRLPLTLIAIAMTVLAVADSGFAYLTANDLYSSGTAVDIGWTAGLLLLAVAAALSRDSGAAVRESVDLPSWASVLLPYAPLMVAAIVAAAQPVESIRTLPVAIAGVILVIAVVARQFLAVGDVRRMAANLAEQGLPAGRDVRALLGELGHAIDNSELDVVYQPQFRLATGKIVGVEALLRWTHPTRGMLGPEEFLPLVRRYGMMESVTTFVLGRALDDAVRWRPTDAGIPVAINFFAPSIVDQSLPDRIAKALTDRGLEAAALTVEITEDQFIKNIGSARAVLERLRQNGTRVSLDDFGSGYSALSYLRDLPIDEVKLDREFVSSVLVDDRAAAVITAVVDLSRALNLSTVVEGVETAAMAVALRDLGCDVGQGYYFSQPLTVDELLESLGPDGTNRSETELMQ